jgi:hypothetical protein
LRGLRAACRAKVTPESLGNTFVKIVVQPVLMGLLVAMLGVAKPRRLDVRSK